MDIERVFSTALLLAVAAVYPVSSDAQVCPGNNLFKSFTVVTNAVYEYYMPLSDGCTLASAAKDTRIEQVSFAEDKLKLAEYLAYAHLRAQAASEDILPIGANGLRYIKRAYVCNPKKALAMDFEYKGVLCSEYDVVAVSFVLINKVEEMLLEEVMIAFYHNEKFCFALYVSLNDCKVSPDFKMSTGSVLVLYHISTFPFLCHDEYWIQRKYVMECNGCSCASPSGDGH